MINVTLPPNLKMSNEYITVINTIVNCAKRAIWSTY